MFCIILCLLVILKGSAASNYDLGVKLLIDIDTYGSNKSELIFTRQFEAPSRSYSLFSIHGFNQGFLSHAVFQLHAFHYNVTLSLENTITQSNHQNGTNLGFILRPGNNSQTLYLWNNNYDDVQCLVAIVVYNRSAPIVGGCSMENDLSDNPILNVTEEDNFIVVQTPLAMLSTDMANKKRIQCGDNTTEPMEYLTYYMYLEQLNFHHDVYFHAIRSMLVDNMIRNGFQAKQVYSPLKRYFEKLPGTGIVFNSLVIDKKGQKAFYIPVVTFSCPINTWSNHCTDIDMLRRAVGVLLVLYSVVMVLNLVMPELIESLMNGMLIGSFSMLVFLRNHHVIMSSFDIFMTTIFGGFFVAAIFGTISLYFRIGRYLTKLTFSCLVVGILAEILFSETTSLYWQLGLAFLLSLVFFFIRISFSVFLGGLLLIMGLSQLLKIGNIHRYLVNNFHALTTVYNSVVNNDSVWDFKRHNFINYSVNLNLLDYSLMLFYVVGGILLTIRKESYFRDNPNIIDSDHFFSACDDIEEFNRNVARNRRDNCLVGIQRTANGQLIIVSRCRRRHHYRSNVINERSPLISHWLASDEEEDDVFESPNSNLRYMRTLSSDSKERIDAIQNFSG